jgi:hypothetical protein
MRIRTKFPSEAESLAYCEKLLCSTAASAFVVALEAGGWKIVSQVSDEAFPTMLPARLAPWWTQAVDGPGQRRANEEPPQLTVIEGDRTDDGGG